MLESYQRPYVRIGNSAFFSAPADFSQPLVELPLCIDHDFVEGFRPHAHCTDDSPIGMIETPIIGKDLKIVLIDTFPNLRTRKWCQDVEPVAHTQGFQASSEIDRLPDGRFRFAGQAQDK